MNIISVELQTVPTAQGRMRPGPPAATPQLWLRKGASSPPLQEASGVLDASGQGCASLRFLLPTSLDACVESPQDLSTTARVPSIHADFPTASLQYRGHYLSKL